MAEHVCGCDELCACVQRSSRPASTLPWLGRLSSSQTDNKITVSLLILLLTRPFPCPAPRCRPAAKPVLNRQCLHRCMPACGCRSPLRVGGARRTLAPPPEAVGIFYSTSSGNTEGVANMIKEVSAALGVISKGKQVVVPSFRVHSLLVIHDQCRIH